MPTFSSTIKIAGLTEVEAGRVMARLRHMQSVGLISKEISIERIRAKPSEEGIPAYPLHENSGL